MSDGWRVEQLDTSLWALDDRGEDSVYLVEGRERALCIDAGLYGSRLMPVIRTLTDRPVDLVLTHAHIDHMRHANEFDRVFIPRADVLFWRENLRTLYALGHLFYRVPPTPFFMKRAVPFEPGRVFDLGGAALTAIPAPGHTPGSTVFADDAHRALFTGDAFGSGEAAWMYLKGCMDVGAYRDSLRELLPRLEPYRDYRFLGGHRLQCGPSDLHPHGHPLTIRVAEDMEVLCERMLSGEVPGKRVRLVPWLRLKVYSYGHASMVQRRSKIR